MTSPAITATKESLPIFLEVFKVPNIFHRPFLILLVVGSHVTTSKVEWMTMGGYVGRVAILADTQAWRSLVSSVANGRSRRLANSRYEAS